MISLILSICYKVNPANIEKTDVINPFKSHFYSFPVQFLYHFYPKWTFFALKLIP